MALDSPDSWPPARATWTAEDAAYGRVHVAAGTGLHPKQRSYRDAAGRLAIVEGTVVRVAVSRLPGRARAAKTRWLWWAGPPGVTADLGLLWRAYVRRFDIEHTVRFCKRTLAWSLPRPRTPEAADRFTWAVLAASTQLRLARGLVADLRLPWERPLPAARLTPGRVRRRFRVVLAAVGTPAGVPKPAGRSPGRPRGSLRGRAPRYPAVKAMA